MDHASVSGIMGKGGTILGSARCLEFHDQEIRTKVIQLLSQLNVRALIVVGGDGSLTGARLLAAESNLRVIGVPATIDNDLRFTDMALGVDTAVKTLVWAVDHFIDTARSHRRVMVLETMGRQSGDLARMAGLASGAEMIITPESGALTNTAMERLAAKIESAMSRGRGHAIVLVAEGVQFDPPQRRNRAYVLMDAFQQYFQRPGGPFPDLEVRPSVLGIFSVADTPRRMTAFLLRASRIAPGNAFKGPNVSAASRHYAKTWLRSFPTASPTCLSAKFSPARWISSTTT
jgi:6-phosphofructokinase 1